MDKVFKYYAIAPLTLGNIFSADKNLKLKDFEIIWNGTKYTCDSEEVYDPSEKNFFTIDRLKKFIKNDELAKKIIKLLKSNINDEGHIIRNENLYLKEEKSDDGKIKLYIDEKIETNNLITIDGVKLDKYYIIPLETIKYLIQEELEETKFDTKEEKELEYNKKLFYRVKESIFNNNFKGLIKSYQIGDDAEVDIDECLNLEDVKKIYKGIKNNKTIKINTIVGNNNFCPFDKDFRDEDMYKKWKNLEKGININPNFYLGSEDLSAYLQKKLGITEKIEFKTVHDDENGIDNITIKIPDKYLVDRFYFDFIPEKDKKYIKADIVNKTNLKMYDFKINPSYKDIVETLKKEYDLDDSNYTLEYDYKTISNDQNIIKKFNNIITVKLKDNPENEKFLTDEKPKEITLRIIGEDYYISIYLDDFKNNELFKWSHESLKVIKNTNNISNFDIKFYKDKEAKEEIQIPDNDNNIIFDYKEGDDNDIYISISEKEKDKGKKDDSTDDKGKGKDKENTEQPNPGDGQGTEGNETKEKKGCYKYK